MNQHPLSARNLIHSLLIVASIFLLSKLLPLPSLFSAFKNWNSKVSTSVLPTAQASTPTLRATVWSDQFESDDWLNHWRVRRGGRWGLDNTEVMDDPSGRFEKILRVRYPAGSASPTVARQTGAPVGGAQFFGGLGLAPSNRLRLRYYVKFSKDFDFVKGGKLPGLFGGTVNDGRRIPDGTNGFSTRYMWRRNGAGEVYAYLPTSSEHGTSLGRGNWRFKPGVWQRLEQEVTLNTPGKSDGRIQVWVDGNLVLSANNLTFRTTENLRIEGILFSTFFGGGDPSWATPEDVYVDFADFAVN